MACINHCQVLPEDLKTLEGNNWLNDKVIESSFMWMLIRMKPYQ